MKSTLRAMLACPALAVALLLGHASGPSTAAAQSLQEVASLDATTEPPAFDSADAAVTAFKEALRANDIDALAKLLGLDVVKLKADANTATTFIRIRDGAARQLVVEDESDRKLIEIGDKLWTLPFPLVKGSDGKWAFDTYAGLEEIVNRRVGANELEAIASMRAYVDAQNDYFLQDHDNDGVPEYAQKLISSKGATDGLYWPAEQGDGDSPAGDFVDQVPLGKAIKGEGYFGYRFRILTKQGANIAGGAYDYVINGNMIAGFALIAWPVKYGETGVKTFEVNQHGIVYEADLGANTDAVVKHINSFNPDKGWDVVGD